MVSSEQDLGKAGKNSQTNSMNKLNPIVYVQYPELYHVKVINVLTIANPRIIASRGGSKRKGPLLRRGKKCSEVTVQP